MSKTFYSPPFKHNGFTLVELLLVVALMSISFGVTSDILVTLMRSFNKTTVINELEQQAGAVTQMIEKEIKNAAVVTNPGGNTNILQFEDTLGAVAFYEYRSDNGIGTLYRYPFPQSVNSDTNRRRYSITINPSIYPATGNPSANRPIGGASVTCTNAAGCFRVNAGRPSIVQIDFRFTQSQASANNSYSGHVDISQTIVARNTY